MRYTNEEINKRSKRNETKRKLIKIIVYIIAIPIIIYNLFIIVFSIINQDETPNLFGIKTFVVVSGSMEPNLNIGDIVVVKKCNENEIDKNDIISYRYGESIITHRIVEIIETENGREYITKGDNNNVNDNINLKYEDIEGKYVGKIKYIGKMIMFLKSKEIMILIVASLCFIYWCDVRNEEKFEIRREKRENFEKERDDKM